MWKAIKWGFGLAVGIALAFLAAIFAVAFLMSMAP
jgi:hypothetical protein